METIAKPTLVPGKEVVWISEMPLLPAASPGGQQRYSISKCFISSCVVKSESSCHGTRIVVIDPDFELGIGGSLLHRTGPEIMGPISKLRTNLPLVMHR